MKGVTVTERIRRGGCMTTGDAREWAKEVEARPEKKLLAGTERLRCVREHQPYLPGLRPSGNTGVGNYED